jgi:hypothetical protein
MKRKANARLPKSSSSRIITWPVKLSTDEALELEKRVLHYARGNRSLYLRAAALNYKPKKEDFEK